MLYVVASFSCYVIMSWLVNNFRIDVPLLRNPPPFIVNLNTLLENSRVTGNLRYRDADGSAINTHFHLVEFYIVHIFFHVILVILAM